MQLIEDFHRNFRVNVEAVDIKDRYLSRKLSLFSTEANQTVQIMSINLQVIVKTIF